MFVMEAGLMETWTKKHWPVSPCKGAGSFAEVSTVNLQTLYPLITVLASGIALAGVTLLLEIVWKSSHMSNYTQQKHYDVQK